MRIVINSSPIIALSCINKLYLLDLIFDEVIIPKAVYKETVLIKNDIKIKDEIEKLKNVKILAPKNLHLVEFISDVLDEGEAEVIAIAKELELDTVIIDEKKGRMYARKHDLTVVGSLGILIMAKKMKLIDNISSSIDTMEEFGIRIGNKLKEIILKNVDEL